MNTNTQEENAKTAELYLSNIKESAGRKQLVKNHQELKIPVEAYEFAMNALDFVPISNVKKSEVLTDLAKHNAEKIEQYGAESFGEKDRLYAHTIVEEVEKKRNAASAQFFYENIDNLMTRSKMVTDPKHSELSNAYYNYIHAENTKDTHGHEQGSEAMSIVKENMTKQIRENSPESFRSVEHVSDTNRNAVLDR